MTTTIDRFWRKVAKTGDCWLWTGALSHGYGNFWDPRLRRTARAHRFAYELLVGPIPEGLEIDHLCRVRNCVRPEHLEPVVGAENMRRKPEPGGAFRKRLTHCKRGHPLSGPNVRLDRRGCRICRTCSAERTRNHRSKKKEQANGRS